MPPRAQIRDIAPAKLSPLFAAIVVLTTSRGFEIVGQYDISEFLLVCAYLAQCCHSATMLAYSIAVL